MDFLIIDKTCMQIPMQAETFFANETAAKTLPHEEGITLSVVGDWHDWLRQNECELKIISRLNPADDKIERVEL